MYEELVQALRHCVFGDCIDCSYRDNCASLNTQAADAIEEAEMNIRHLERDYKELCSYLPKWIPVTNRLPEEYKDVLCYYEYFRYGDYNCMFRTIDRGYYGDGRWGGEAGQGHKNKVLAWMPLPEPPKEK